MTIRPTIYSGMEFPPYEFREYPKALDVPAGFETEYDPGTKQKVVYSADEELETLKRWNPAAPPAKAAVKE